MPRTGPSAAHPVTGYHPTTSQVTTPWATPADHAPRRRPSRQATHPVAGQPARRRPSRQASRPVAGHPGRPPAPLQAIPAGHAARCRPSRQATRSVAGHPGRPPARGGPTIYVVRPLRKGVERGDRAYIVGPPLAGGLPGWPMAWSDGWCGWAAGVGHGVGGWPVAGGVAGGGGVHRCGWPAGVAYGVVGGAVTGGLPGWPMAWSDDL